MFGLVSAWLVSTVTAFLLAATTEPEQPLLEYGAIGFMALIALLVARELFKRLNLAHERELARADRLEDELRKLNALVQERYLSTLSAATQAISEAMAMLKERR